MGLPPIPEFPNLYERLDGGGETVGGGLASLTRMNGHLLRIASWKRPHLGSDGLECGKT